MKIEQISPRLNWQKTCEDAGFFFHSVDGRYWIEDYCYAFQEKEIEVIKKAANELHFMYLDMASDIIKAGDYFKFGFKDEVIAQIEGSWRLKEKNGKIDNVYSRFDFSYTDLTQPPKLLEYNADTPTTLLEGAIIQAQWYQDKKMGIGQFNNIDEDLVNRWKNWHKDHPDAKKIFLTCQYNIGDVDNAYYMLDVVKRAGLDTEFIRIEELQFDKEKQAFISPEGENIKYCFKLYPWEWLASDDAFPYIEGNIQFIEPAWKLLLSNKAILAYLWKKYTNHPNLLPTYWNIDDCFKARPDIHKVVEKQIYGREGCNMKIIEHGEVIEETLGAYYGDSIVQQYWPLPCLEGRWPMVGVWMVGDVASGIGVRDDSVKITQDTSWFAPHYIYK